MNKMIRSSLTLSVGIGLLASTIVPAVASPMDSFIKNDLINICHAVKSDNRIQLHNAVKRSRLSVDTIRNGLLCNGQSAIDFATQHKALHTAKTLGLKTRVRVTQLTSGQGHE